MVTRDPRYMNSPKLPPLPGIPVETSKGAFHCRGDSEATTKGEAHPSHETGFFQAADQSLVRDLKDTRLVFFPEPGVNCLVVRIGFVDSNFESELKMHLAFDVTHLYILQEFGGNFFFKVSTLPKPLAADLVPWQLCAAHRACEQLVRQCLGFPTRSNDDSTTSRHHDITTSLLALKLRQNWAAASRHGPSFAGWWLVVVGWTGLGFFHGFFVGVNPWLSGIHFTKPDFATISS